MEGDPFFHNTVLGQSVLDRPILDVGQHVVIAIHRADPDFPCLPGLFQGAGGGSSGRGVDADDHIQVRMGLNQLGRDGESVGRV